MLRGASSMAEQRTFNPLVQGSTPWRPTQPDQVFQQSGHIAQLPSGSYRVEVNLGTDPITRRRIRLRESCKYLVAAQITLGKLLA